MSQTGTPRLTPGRTRLAMRLNILTGCLATVWGIVLTPQAIFNVFFQNRLGAGPSALGLLVALLQLTGVFQLFSIFIYGLSPRKKPIFVAAHLVHRLLTLVVAWGAFRVAAGGDRGLVVRFVMLAVPLSWAFMNVSAAGWWSWVADLFPEEIRGSFFLKRSALINVINIAWFFLASMLLDLFDGPSTFIVYGIIFAIGAASGIVDIILNLFIPEPLPERRRPFSWRDSLEPLSNRNFIAFAAAVGFATFSINLAVPFQAPFVVHPHRVGAPNTWLGIMYVLSQLTWVLVAPFWGTVMDKWGRKPVVVLGCMYSLSWVGYFFLTPVSYVFLLPIISVAGGFFAPAFYEGVNQMMLTLTPEKNRISFVAWYMAIVGVISAGGSFCGGLIMTACRDLVLRVGPFRFGDFHVVQLISIISVVASAVVLSRVREGRVMQLGFVVSRVVNPSIFRTFAFMDDLAKTTDPDRATQALRAIERDTGDLAIEEILLRLDDPYPEIQEEAARTLGRLRSPLAVDALTARLKDSGSSVRVAAARALGKIGDRRAVDALAATLREAQSEELQDACVQALGDIGGDRSIEEILLLYKSSSSDRVRASAADAASRLGLFEAAWEIFPRLVETGNGALRKQYAIAMGNILGVPGEFYRYVTGTEASRLEQARKLMTKLQSSLKPIRARLAGEAGKSLPRPQSRGSDADLAARVGSIRDSLESDAPDRALATILDLSEGLLESIFGHGAREEGFVQIALRVDQRLGAFSWILIEIRRRMSRNFDKAPAPAEVQRILTLLCAYFLASF